MDLHGKALGREEILHQQGIFAAAVALEPYLAQRPAIGGPEALRYLGSTPRL
jgi:hypothetical protein